MNEILMKKYKLGTGPLLMVQDWLVTWSKWPKKWPSNNFNEMQCNKLHGHGDYFNVVVRVGKRFPQFPNTTIKLLTMWWPKKKWGMNEKNMVRILLQTVLTLFLVILPPLLLSFCCYANCIKTSIDCQYRCH